MSGSFRPRVVSGSGVRLAVTVLPEPHEGMQVDVAVELRAEPAGLRPVAVLDGRWRTARPSASGPAPGGRPGSGRAPNGNGRSRGRRTESGDPWVRGPRADRCPGPGEGHERAHQRLDPPQRHLGGHGGSQERDEPTQRRREDREHRERRGHEQGERRPASPGRPEIDRGRGRRDRCGERDVGKVGAGPGRLVGLADHGTSGFAMWSSTSLMRSQQVAPPRAAYRYPSRSS